MAKGKTGKGKKRPTEDDDDRDERRARVGDDESEEAPPRKKKGKERDEDGPEDGGENGEDNGGEGDESEEAPPRKKKGKERDEDEGGDDQGPQKATELSDDKLRKYKPLPPDEPIIPPSPDCFGVLHNPKSDKCQICEEHHNGMCLAVMLMRQRQQQVQPAPKREQIQKGEKPMAKKGKEQDTGKNGKQSAGKSTKVKAGNGESLICEELREVLTRSKMKGFGVTYRYTPNETNKNKFALLHGDKRIGWLTQTGQADKFRIRLTLPKSPAKLGLLKEDWGDAGGGMHEYTGDRSPKTVAVQLAKAFSAIATAD